MYFLYFYWILFLISLSARTHSRSCACEIQMCTILYIQLWNSHASYNNSLSKTIITFSRYCVAAQNLVMAARGRNTARGWRISKDDKKFSDIAELKDTDPASYDDISVFVIPLSKKFQDQPETVRYPVSKQPSKQSDEIVCSNENNDISGPETNANLSVEMEPVS